MWTTSGLTLLIFHQSRVARISWQNIWMGIYTFSYNSIFSYIFSYSNYNITEIIVMRMPHDLTLTFLELIFQPGLPRVSTVQRFLRKLDHLAGRSV